MSDAARTAYLARCERIAAVIVRAAEQVSADPVAEVAKAMSPVAWQLAADQAGVRMPVATMVPDVLRILRAADALYDASGGALQRGGPDSIASDRLVMPSSVTATRTPSPFQFNTTSEK